MPSYLNYSYCKNGVNVIVLSANKLKELVRLFPFYNFPEGSGPHSESNRVWPEPGDDYDPLEYSLEFGWEWMD